MFEYFIMLGTLCTAPFNLPTAIKCINFYDKPAIYYENKEKCVNRAKEFSKEVEIKLNEKNLFIVGIQIYCQPVKKVDVPT